MAQQNKLESKLANMQITDAQLRKRVLGYTHWFSPAATKADLFSNATPEQYLNMGVHGDERLLACEPASKNGDEPCVVYGCKQNGALNVKRIENREINESGNVIAGEA